MASRDQLRKLLELASRPGTPHEGINAAQKALNMVLSDGFVPGSLECNRCHHVWTKRGAVDPKQCPECRSPYWNKDRVRKK